MPLKKILLLVAVLFSASLSKARDVSFGTQTFNLNGFKLSLSPSIHDETYRDNISKSILQNLLVKQRLIHTDYLIFSEEFTADDFKNNADNSLSNKGIYTITAYDYTKNSCLLLQSANPFTQVQITETTEQTDPTEDEF